MFRDPNRFTELIDPLIKGEVPKKSLNQAIAVAVMCLQDDASVRPLIGDVVTALSFLWIGPESDLPSPAFDTSPPSDDKVGGTEEDHFEEVSTGERDTDVKKAV